MPDLTLYYAPDTCARVPLTALEHIGCGYKLEVIAFMKGDHRSPDYLSLNPSGKVPTLVVDGEPLTENVAILSWLDDTFPEAGLLPPAQGLGKARQMADLAYCASGLHPIVTRLRIPQYFCELPEAHKNVFAMAETAMRLHFTSIEQRLAGSPWWYGNQWSVVDAYINWVWFRVSGTSFDTTQYVNFSRHDRESQLQPSAQRMLEKNRAIANTLDQQGLAVTFSGDAGYRPPTN